MTSDNRSVSAPARKDNSFSGALVAGQRFNPFNIFTGVYIPEVLARYRGLSPLAKITWGRLARYAGENGECYPSLETLASEVAVKKRRICQVVQELMKKGFIDREKRYGRGGQTSNAYFFLAHPVFLEAMAVRGTQPSIPAKPAQRAGRATTGNPGRRVHNPAPTPVHDPALTPVHDPAPEESHIEESHLKSSSPATITDTASRFTLFDDDASRQLLTKCRAKAPDATPKEVAAFLEAKCHQWAKSRKEITPGLILTGVPKLFEGPRLAEYRHEQARKASKAAAEAAEKRAYWQSILNDPRSDETDRAFAREALG